MKSMRFWKPWVFVKVSRKAEKLLPIGTDEFAVAERSVSRPSEAAIFGPAVWAALPREVSAGIERRAKLGRLTVALLRPRPPWFNAVKSGMPLSAKVLSWAEVSRT